MSLSPIRNEGVQSYTSNLGDSLSSTLEKVVKVGVAVLRVMAFVQIPTPVNAQEIVGSAEFRINTFIENSQSSPDVAALPFLGEEMFVSIWYSRFQVADFNLNVFGQLFDGESKEGEEFRVDQGSHLQQTSPRVAHLGNGSFITTWEAEEIYIRSFDSQAVPMGPALIANTHRANAQTSAVLATSWKGTTALIWNSWGSPGRDKNEIAGQFLYQNTNFLGGEIIVNEDIVGQQYGGNIAVFQDASFVTSWLSSSTQYDGFFGQRFDSDGNRIGGSFSIYNSNDYFESLNLCTLDNNDFVAVSTLDRGVFAQIHLQNGAVRIPKFQIYNLTFDSQNTELSFSLIPECTGLPGRGFSVVWPTYWINIFTSDPRSKGIYLRSFDYLGFPIGPEVRVDQNTTLLQRSPRIDALPNGKVIIVWEGFSSNNTYSSDVKGRVVDPILSISSSSSSQSSFNNETTSASVSSSYASTSDPVYSPSLNSGQVPAASTSARSSYASTSDPVYSPSPNSGQVPLASTSAPSSYASTSDPVYSPSPNSGQVPVASTSAPSSYASTQAKSFTSSLSAKSESIGSSTAIIHSVIDLRYEQLYPIVIDGQTVGNFSFSGGEGTLNSDNPNVLSIDLDPSYTLQDGAIITLFTIPQGEEALWQDIVLEFDNDSQCVSVEGESVFDEQEQHHDYVLVFEFTSSECSVATQASALQAIPALLSGTFT